MVNRGPDPKQFELRIYEFKGFSDVQKISGKIIKSGFIISFTATLEGKKSKHTICCHKVIHHERAPARI